MHVGTQHFLSAFGEAEVEGLGAGGSDAAVTKGFPFLPGSRSAHVSLSPASFPGCQEAPDEPAEQSRAGEDPALCLRPDGPQGGPGGGGPEGDGNSPGIWCRAQGGGLPPAAPLAHPKFLCR